MLHTGSYRSKAARGRLLRPALVIALLVGMLIAGYFGSTGNHRPVKVVTEVATLYCVSTQPTAPFPKRIEGIDRGYFADPRPGIAEYMIDLPRASITSISPANFAIVCPIKPQYRPTVAVWAYERVGQLMLWYLNGRPAGPAFKLEADLGVPMIAGFPTAEAAAAALQEARELLRR